MTAAEAFIDTNVLLYLLSSDEEKADRAESLVSSGGLISVQVLNELTNVARRKLALPWRDIKELLSVLRRLCVVVPLTVETHDRGRLVAERYGLSIYDAMIVSAALLGGCRVLYSEDMQDGLPVEAQLRISNPFSTA